MAGDPGTVLIANPGADLYGSDRMTVESVKALVNGGFTVFVTVPGPGPLIELLTDAGATVLEQPTPIIRKSLLSPGGLVQLVRETLSAWAPSWRLLKHTNAGTVLVNTITPPLWFPLARLAGRNLACHVHEAERATNPLLRSALYLPLVFCRRIVINSRFCLDVLAESAPWLVKRATIVHNTVPGPSEVVPPREQLTGAARLMYMGRLSHRKGPHVLVDAVELLKRRGRRVRLTLVGAVFPGNEAYEEGLRRQVAELGLDDEVEFLGFRSVIWPTLADNDIVLISSVGDESFGNTAVEASLGARPVVVSDIPGLREASQAASAAIRVTPGDVTGFADAVETIIDDWAGYRAAAVRDAETVAEKFSAAQYGRGLIDAMGLSR
ncbi:MAG: glycosyltransferase family 4 protein [Micropruina sp.]|uniref:glycosyltransferase family 4 protein n=1 Tax=Micropruina sp. TaxID=2737536 RepID=UPI0039E5CD84